MNGAGLILEKGTGHVLIEVVECQLARGFGFGQPILFDHAVDEAGVGKGEKRLMKSLGQFLLARFGKAANPVAERLGLEDADGHHLAAAGAATGLAGDVEAGFAQLRGDAANERVVKRL